MKTALYEKHVNLNAKIVDFAGWEMPVQYQGIIQEHQAVRNAAGIFDVSHMGFVEVSGEDAGKFLEFLSTNKVSEKNDLTATYTVWCHENGGSVDDVIVYRENAHRFFVVVNAGNRQKDLQHMQHYASNYKVKITDHFNDYGILAIQGPKAKEVVSTIFPEASQIKLMHFKPLPNGVYISGTGYTGSGGLEIMAPLSMIPDLWNQLLDKGKNLGLVPVGLGARDTLRLEMGYALYGHELGDAISPSESVSSWTIKFDKPNFLGKNALQKIENTKRGEYGVILTDKGIAREGYEVYQNGKHIGHVTSGTFSPSLNQAIAIILVNIPLKPDDLVEIKIRQSLAKAVVTKLPFYKAK